MVNLVRSEALMEMVLELSSSIFKDATIFGDEVNWKIFILKTGRGWKDTS
jgi:hypothetical protein